MSRSMALPLRVVIDPAAGQCEQFAAAELAKYLRRMVGRGLPVRRSSRRRRGDIRIHARRRSGRPRVPVGRHDDAFAIHVMSDRVVLSGQTERAALYATYAFLEELGCRWLAPAFDFYKGIGHEVVPRLRDWEPRPGRRRFQPTFLYRRRTLDEGRSSTVANTIQLIEWMAKNRLNALEFSIDYEGTGRFIWNSVRGRLVPQLRKRGMLIFVGGHGYQNFLHPDEFFDRYPEWFGQIDGQRTRNANCVFNTTSRGALRMFVSRVVEYLQEHPEIDILNLWPPDHVRWSEDRKSLAQGSPSRRQAIVTKAVRDGLRRRRIPVLVETTAYANHADFPEDFAYPKDVIVDVCPFYHEHREPIFDLSVPSAPESIEPIQRWSDRHQGILGVFCYYRKYKFLSKPVAFPTLMWSELSYYRDRGYQSMSMQSEPGDWISFELQHYMQSRLVWNTAQDINALVKDYCRARYGPATVDMEQYVWTLAKATTRSVRLAGVDVIASGDGYIPTAYEVAQGRLWVDHCGKLLARARRKLVAQRRPSELLKRLAVTLRHMELAFDLLDLGREGHVRKLKEKKQQLLRLARRHKSEGLFFDVDGYWFGDIGIRKVYGV